MSERVALVVPPEAAGQRLDRLLSERHEELSRSRLQALIEQGRVTVDDGPAKASRRLKGGETIVVEIPDPVPAAPQPQDLPLRILHEDAHLVVLDKQAGIVVHPAAGAPDRTLVNALLFHVRDLGGIGGELRPGIVHRLDRDTSGCLVVAKDERTLAALQDLFRTRQVEKRYVALVHGEVAQDSFTIETPYGRHPTVRTRYTGRNPVGPARTAITHVQVIERFAEATRIEVLLETGRTHQIRVHLSEAGHPLLADREYGGARREARLRPDDRVRRAAEAIGRQALHARILAFPHPATGERLRVEAPPPPDFEAALAVLRGS
ncbi:MAG TPA: RluA family pseudouridine synthase [Vulgatibacter sp.]|nr:RluA family pseudouridine synthase [Vulgatibacter sp.]